MVHSLSPCPSPLTVLGTASPHPRPHRPCSGYLLRGGGAEVWVDAGPGTFAELQRHTDPAHLTAVWISHLHADHCSDLLSAVYGLEYGGLTPAAPVPVYAPAGCVQRLAGFFGRPAAGFPDGVLAFRTLHDGHVARHGGLALTAHAVTHDAESYGLRAEAGGRVLAYSGDSGPCPAPDELARDSDLFLCEGGHRHASRRRTGASHSRGRRCRRPPGGGTGVARHARRSHGHPRGRDRTRRRRLRRPHRHRPSRCHQGRGAAPRLLRRKH